MIRFQDLNKGTEGSQAYTNTYYTKKTEINLDLKQRPLENQRQCNSRFTLLLSRSSCIRIDNERCRGTLEELVTILEMETRELLWSLSTSLLNDIVIVNEDEEDREGRWRFAERMEMKILIFYGELNWFSECLA
ncbi:hypothetical protein RYX36_014511 [Vicia faba]